jgi:glycosyltransferase involved in cell wall biosynthesis
VISGDSAGTDVSRTDIVHRPFQVGSEGELERLHRLGDRLILTQQDMIAYRNPGYFPKFQDWWRYRQASRFALGMADAVVFYSAHAQADALAEDLVAPERTHVVGVGTDHRLAMLERAPQRPQGAGDLEDGGFLLCLGADYRHKNRLFALQLVDELQRRHDWRGRLALVGPRVPWGSSAPEEADFLGRHPAVASATVHLAGVSEAEKLWLLQRAVGVVFPTVYEGFGLVPFEAAAAGIPCFFAAQSSLAEVLPIEAATLTAWDPALSADEVMAVLRDPRRIEALVATVRGWGERHRWDAVAERLMTVYQLAADDPRQVGLGRELVDAGISLVGGGPMGELATLSGSEQAALAALARRRYLRVPFFGLLGLWYRMGRVLSAPFRRGRDREPGLTQVVPQRSDTPGGSEKPGVMPPTASST